MFSNTDMKHYIDPATGDKFWIRPEDEPRPGWEEAQQPTGPLLPDPNYVPPYTARRINAYPDINEQMDMLWHAMDADESKRLEPFYSTIRAIKEMIPKE